MKSKIITVILSGVLFSGFANADVIVNDPTAITKMLTQIENLKNQLAVQRQTYESLSHTTDLGTLFNGQTSELMGNLPSNWERVYNDALNSNSSITGTVSSMVDRYNSVIDDMSPQDAIGYVSKQMAQKGATDRAMAERAYNNEMAELESMQKLQQRISTTGDMKSIADLQARIQTAQGAIQGEQTKLQLMSMLQSSQDKIYQQQMDRASANFNFGKNDTINPASMN